MNENEVRGDEPGLIDAAQTDGPIGRCSVCRGEVRWSEAKRPHTSPPVHSDCLEPLRDEQHRTPPHGDPLTPTAYQADCKRLELAGAIARRTPVRLEPIYRELCRGRSAAEIEAAIAVAQRAGVDPSNFDVYLTIPAAFPGVTAAEMMEGAAAFAKALRADDEPVKTDPVLDHHGRVVGQRPLEDVTPAGLEKFVRRRRLPPHIERAARRAWHRGFDSAVHERHHPPGSPMYHKVDDDDGVDAFLMSLKVDADAARRSS